MKTNSFMQEVYLFMIGSYTKYNMRLLEQSEIKEFVRRYMGQNSNLKIQYNEYISKEARERWGKPSVDQVRNFRDVKK